MITILYKKLHPDAKAPVKAHEGDAGWDVTAVEIEESGLDTRLHVEHYLYDTGLAFAPPKGVWLMMTSRSSVCKHGMWLAGGVGIIDNGYRNSVKAAFYHFVMPQLEYGDAYKKGERIAQIIPMNCGAEPVEFKEVDELPESWDGRGEGGFGSSDATWTEIRTENPLNAEHDSVNHPSHYCGFSNGAEVIDITEHLSFNLGNCVKYCARSGRKHEEGMSDFDKRMEDLRKAMWCLGREIERLEKEHKGEENDK